MDVIVPVEGQPDGKRENTGQILDRNASACRRVWQSKTAVAGNEINGTVTRLKLAAGVNRQEAAADRAVASRSQPEEIDTLITALGAHDFTVRQVASQMLERIGLPALAKLVGSSHHEDSEVRFRSRILVERIVSASLRGPTESLEDIAKSVQNRLLSGSASTAELMSKFRTRATEYLRDPDVLAVHIARLSRMKALLADRPTLLKQVEQKLSELMRLPETAGRLDLEYACQLHFQGNDYDARTFLVRAVKTYPLLAEDERLIKLAARCHAERSRAFRSVYRDAGGNMSEIARRQMTMAGRPRGSLLSVR